MSVIVASLWAVLLIMVLALNASIRDEFGPVFYWGLVFTTVLLLFTEVYF